LNNPRKRPLLGTTQKKDPQKDPGPKRRPPQGA